MSPPSRPGEAARALARPLPLAAVAALVLNDHWAKRAHPCWLTGKLSDVAGMVFFPLLLAALAERALGALGRAPRPRRTLAAACAATACAFALAKATAFGNEAYRVGLGYMQWPARAAGAALVGRSLPPPRPVALVPDPSDLLALPFVAVAYALGAGTFGRARARPGRGSAAGGATYGRSKVATTAPWSDAPRDSTTEAPTRPAASGGEANR